MPFDVGLFGEEQMLISFQDHPPDWIVIVPKNTNEYGYRGFGLDYGRQIIAWVWQNYEEVWWIGVPSLEKVRTVFGISSISLLRKRKREASLITSPRTGGINSNQSGVHGAAWADLPCTKPLVFTTRVP